MNYISMYSSEDVIEHYGIKSRSPIVRSEASQYKAMRKHMSATKDRAVLSEMYDQASKSKGRAMAFNNTKAGRLKLVSDAKDSRAEQLRRKASQYMN